MLEIARFWNLGTAEVMHFFQLVLLLKNLLLVICL